MLPKIVLHALFGCRSPNRVNLMEIVESFPFLNKTVTRTCLELLLALEIALQLQGPPVNLMTLFPNWLRNALKKGTYKVTLYYCKHDLVKVVHV